MVRGIVYDFALGTACRTISRDHVVLKSITPLSHLGWIASYALEMEAAGPAQIDAPNRTRLARAYEGGKPYLVFAVGGGPTRFNP